MKVRVAEKFLPDAHPLHEKADIEFDFTLGLPFRYGMGFMLGGDWFGPYGPDTRYAFGHIGFTNIVSWADPERHVAAALLTSGKPVVYPEIYWAIDILRQIGRACGKEPGRPVLGIPMRGTELPPLPRSASS